MPYERFALTGKPEETLKVWARKLNYMFANLNDDNVTSTSILGTDSVKDFMIDFGTGLQQVDALDMPIVDSTNYYTSTSVEGALEEIARVLRNIPASTISLNDTGDYFTSVQVEGALQEVGLHMATTNIHYLTSNISHLVLMNIGLNSHSVLDAHLASTTNPHGSKYTVAVALSTTLAGTTTLVSAVALVSDLNATNSLLNQIRTALINNGLAI